MTIVHLRFISRFIIPLRLLLGVHLTDRDVEQPLLTDLTIGSNNKLDKTTNFIEPISGFYTAHQAIFIETNNPEDMMATDVSEKNYKRKTCTQLSSSESGADSMILYLLLLEMTNDLWQKLKGW